MRHALLLMLCGTVLGCEDPVGLSAEEARLALDQVVLSAAGQATVGDLIELATVFSVGVPQADAAAELAGHIGSLAPCAGPDVAEATISLAYAGCDYNGRTYTGASSITVLIDEVTSVELAHAWVGLSHGIAVVDGSSAVEWSGEGQGLTRHVVHELSWTTPEGVSVVSEGEQLQALMRPFEGIAGGLVINGHRTWTVAGERWDATVAEIEIYGADLVPDDGSYTLLGPGGREYELDFEGEGDGTAISVTVEDGIGRRFLEVDRSGQPIAGE